MLRWLCGACTGAVLVHAACAAAQEAAAAQDASCAGRAQRSEAGRALDIWEFVVDGNSVLADAEIEDAVAPFMGPARSEKDAAGACAALEELYHARGFKLVSVTIPAQPGRDLEDGVLRLQVLETRVGHLTVMNSRFHSLDRIREEAGAIREGEVPNFSALQDDLVTLNRQPDRKVTPALKPGRRPGTVDVDLVVDDALPLHGWLELNNRYSQDTTELRSLATLSYDNLLQRGHSLSLSFQTAPENTDDAKVFFGSYLAPLQGSDWSVLLNLIDTDSDVATVGGVSVLGAGTSVGVTGIRRLDGGPGFFPSISLGITYKDFDTSALLGGDVIETPVKYYPMSLGYSTGLRTGNDQLQFDTSLNFASPQLGSSTRTIQLNRFRARGQMFWVRASLSGTHDFASGLQAFARLGGQATDQPLISNEQYGAGGADTVRGYLEAEALGDVGLSGSLELRSPELSERFLSLPLLEEARLYAFVDAARLELKGPLPDDSTPERAELLAAGAGLSLKFPGLSGTLDWASPLESGPSTDAGDDRVLFRVWSSF